MSRPWIIDGGLATALEQRGHTLHPRLWSAGVFLADPAAVEALHREYLDAGAEILISASYQMSFAGLGREGLDRDAAVEAMRATVRVARAAVERSGRTAMVAASVGPYGATLADGSEYRGDYGLGVDDLVEFHRERFDVLRGAGADLLAIETIPSLAEVEALARLLAPHRTARAWFAFSCRDGTHLCDGRPVAEAARLLADCSQAVAVGVNCTAPRHVAPLLDEIRRASGKPLVAYPNAGERWDAAAHRWRGEISGDDFVAQARTWAARGAWAVGGCCRVGPATIRKLASALGA